MLRKQVQEDTQWQSWNSNPSLLTSTSVSLASIPSSLKTQRYHPDRICCPNHTSDQRQRTRVLDEALHRSLQEIPAWNRDWGPLSTQSLPSSLKKHLFISLSSVILWFYLQPLCPLIESVIQLLLSDPLQGVSSSVRNTGHQYESKRCFLSSGRLLSKRSDTAIMRCPQI